MARWRPAFSIFGTQYQDVLRRKGNVLVRPNVVDWIATVLVIVGGLNWGLVGAFDWDLVAAIFGEDSSLARIVYILVGLAAIWMIYMAARMAQLESGRLPTRA